MADLQPVTDAYNAAIQNTALAIQARNDAIAANPYDDIAYHAADTAFDACQHAQTTSRQILDDILQQGADITALLTQLTAANAQMTQAAASLDKTAQTIKTFANVAGTVLGVLAQIAPFFL